MRVGRQIWWVSMLVLGLTVHAAEAETNRRVVVIRPAVTDDIRSEAVARVQGELTAAGFEVVAVLEKEGTDVLSAVDLVNREMQPLAVFAIFASTPSLTDEATAQILFSASGRTLIERMPLDRQHPDHGAKVLAVRAVELLKANLVELWVRPDRGAISPTTAPSLATAPSPRVEAAPPPASRAPLAGFGLEAALGVIQQFHAVGASVMPVFKVSLASQLGLGGRLSVGGLGSTSTAGAAFGLARVQQQLGVADLFYSFPRLRTFQWLVSGGAGVCHVRVEGDGFDPYQGRTTQTWSAMAKAGWGAAVTLAPRVSFMAELEGMVAFSPTRVLVGDTEVGRMGSPALLFSAGIVGVF